MSVRIVVGDCRHTLRALPDDSVHCCVTSPPYFGLRDYGHDGQIGLEASPADYVEQMVAVFREVRRVLRDDGTLWLNLGDSYATTSTYAAPRTSDGEFGRVKGLRQPKPSIPQGLKPKDLIGIPWRVAFALQADGWWLRQDIIWHKPNPMPESVTDRCTKAHEYVFLLSKAERYWFDAKAIAEPAISDSPAGNTKPQDAVPGLAQHNNRSGLAAHAARSRERKDQQRHAGNAVQAGFAGSTRHAWEQETRNRRSVWTVTTQPFSGAHFATMPPELAELCIRAGCPEGGTVLDPFGGAGTTGLVADGLQRDAVLCELNEKYAEIARLRIEGDAPLLSSVAVETEKP